MKRAAGKKAAPKRKPKTENTARERALTRLRRICMKLEGTVEHPSFGNPAFRVGTRIYAVLDRYKGKDCIFVYVDAGQRDVLLRAPHFFKAPYDPREKGICRSLEAIDWAELKALIIASHGAVAHVKTKPKK